MHIDNNETICIYTYINKGISTCMCTQQEGKCLNIKIKHVFSKKAEVPL